MSSSNPPRVNPIDRPLPKGKAEVMGSEKRLRDEGGHQFDFFDSDGSKHSIFLKKKKTSAQPLDVRVPLLGDRTVQSDARAEHRRTGEEVRADEEEKKFFFFFFFFFFFAFSTTDLVVIDLADPDPLSFSSLSLPLSLSLLFSSSVSKKKNPPRLEDLGHGVGASLLELLCWRERGGKRTPTALDAVKFAHSSLWRALFGRQARVLEQSNTVRSRGCCFSAPSSSLLCFVRKEQRAGRRKKGGASGDRKERARERGGGERREKKKTLGISKIIIIINSTPNSTRPRTST